MQTKTHLQQQWDFIFHIKSTKMFYFGIDCQILYCVTLTIKIVQLSLCCDINCIPTDAVTHFERNLLCISESFLSITLYLFTLAGPDVLCHAHTTVTVVLVTPTTFNPTASISAETINEQLHPGHPCERDLDLNVVTTWLNKGLTKIKKNNN